MCNFEICPITGLPLSTILTLKNQPIFMGTTSQPYELDGFHDMTWGTTSTGAVHLMSRLPLSVLYAESHNSGLIGSVWEKHHLEFANFIAEFSPKDVCEIGGGHGILSRNFQSITNYNSWEIFEPNPIIEAHGNITIRRELFSETSEVAKKDCFVHSHLFEHLYDHKLILNKIHDSLTDNGIMIFSVPNMSKMLEKGYVNALNFEHVTYLTEGLIEYILSVCGFKVICKKYFMDDHSIFYAVEKVSNCLQVEFNENENTAHVLGFFSKILNDIKRLNDTMRDLSPEVDIFMFGAHIFSQFYLSNGLDGSKIHSIIDNDTSKANKRMYGTSLFVNKPDIIRDIRLPVVLLKVGAYRDEISKQLLSLNPNTLLIE